MSVVGSTTEMSNREQRWWTPAFVYRLYDANGTLLYIGSAYDADQRCKEHAKQPWWPEVARRTEQQFPNRGHAYTEELKAIAVEGSKYNVMGTREYETPKTEAILRRNALSGVRQQLLTAASGAGLDIYYAAREAGYPYVEAKRAGTLAEIEFLDRTGLFVASVKRRRKQFELHGS